MKRENEFVDETKRNSVGSLPKKKRMHRFGIYWE